MNDNMVFELDAVDLSLDATPMIAPRDYEQTKNLIKQDTYRN